MKFKLHQQRGKIESLIGEDAAPYISDKVLMVADGLGGDGGFIHTKINPAIFNPNKLFNEIYGNLYNLDSEETPAFLVDHLNNLYGDYIFKISDEIYHQNLAKNGRTSGYFASRLLTSLVLCELNLNPDLNQDDLFKRLLAPNADTNKIQEEFGDLFYQNIYEKYPKVAKNAWLEVESMIKNTALLPSTLSLVMYQEQKDYIDAVFIWAGDSRAYVLNLLGNDKSTGLSQITEDDELNETMNNCIYANRSFRINCKYVRIPKPCILWDCTDGCFDTFRTSLQLEWFILDTLKNQDNVDDFVNHMHQDFMGYSPDDSTTIACKSFGYVENDEDDYPIIKEYAIKRIEQMQKDYLDEANDFLTVDYDEQLNINKQLINRVFVECKTYIDRNETLKAFILNYLYDKKPNEEIVQLFEKKAIIEKELQEKNNEAKHKLIEVVTTYWGNIRDLVIKQTPIIDQNKLIDSTFLSKVEKVENEINNYTIQFNKKINEYRRELTQIFDVCTKTLDLLEEAPNIELKDLDEYKEKIQSENLREPLVTQMENSIFSDICNLYKEVVNTSNSKYVNMLVNKQNLDSVYMEAGLYEKEYIEYTVDRIINNDLELTDFPNNVKNAIDDYFQATSGKLMDNDSNLDMVNNDIKAKVIRYWSINYQSIIFDLLETVEFKNDITIQQKIDKYKALIIAKEDVLAKNQTHKNVLDKYNINYGKYLRY